MSTRNLLMLLAAFVTAILLRLAINPSAVAEVEREFEAPLTLNGLPEGLAVVQAPATVTLVASGTVTEVDRFEARTVRAYADLSGAKQGTARFQVASPAPVGARVSLRPKNPTVTIEAERADSKSFPVELIDSGLIDARYVLEGMSAEPPSVTCTGPASLMGRIKQVTAAVDLTRLEPGSVMELDAVALDGSGRPVPGLALNPTKVKVTAVVLNAPQTRQLPVSIIFRGQLPPGYVLVSATVTPSQAVVRGDPAVLSGMGSAQTEPIALGTLKSDSTYTVGLDLPAGASSDSSMQYKVQLKVRRQRTDSGSP